MNRLWSKITRHPLGGNVFTYPSQPIEFGLLGYTFFDRMLHCQQDFEIFYIVKRKKLAIKIDQETNYFTTIIMIF